MFWGAFRTLVLRERKINSKPRFKNELELTLACSGLRPAQRFPYQFTVGSAVSYGQNGWKGRNVTRSLVF